MCTAEETPKAHDRQAKLKKYQGLKQKENIHDEKSSWRMA
jgi:hypothetical protein